MIKVMTRDLESAIEAKLKANLFFQANQVFKIKIRNYLVDTFSLLEQQRTNFSLLDFEFCKKL